ncbi:MAG: DUF1549 and DUF1553 domain-containing protein, partial [Verrucomicrobiota bacterium]
RVAAGVVAGWVSLAGATAADTSAGPTQLWSFARVERPAVPPAAAGHSANPIDRFVGARLAAAGLPPNPRASRRVLYRRASFDLLGLPPSFEEVRAFEADPRPEAWERVVDRMLASPRMGERWARHWLDVVRFAQSNGYERDGEKPGAWRYRDYVVRAFNEDRPWDRIVREHLAGDELEPFSPDALVATGFTRLGVLDDEPDDPEMAVFDELDDVLSTTGVAFLGLTLGCARCHDHKFDPIPQADYYRLLAFFRGLEPGRHLADPAKSTAHVPLADPARVAAWRKTQAERIAAAEAELAVTTEDGARKALAARLEGWRRELPPFELALAARESSASPAPTFVLRRGSARAPGEAVQPAFLSAVSSRPADGPEPSATSPTSPTSGRRRQLADWMASRGHPLTARVIVNRLWHHHFGRGLVRTTGDFGRAGSPPTHPELLDWLAAELMDQGWSLKHLHRLILTSATWQRSSRVDPAGVAARLDPGNDLLWRQNLRRLEAEAVRDTVLAASGRLNLAAGGRGFFPHLGGEVLEGGSRPGTDWEASPVAEQSRRSLYAYVRRTSPVPFLELLDYNNSSVPLTERPTTTVAPQALMLLNDDFLREQADALAGRVGSGGAALADSLRQAWRLVLARDPSDAELRLAGDYWTRHRDGAGRISRRFTVRTDVPATMNTAYFRQLAPGHFVRLPSGWIPLRGHWPDQYEGNQILRRGEGPAGLVPGLVLREGTLHARLLPHPALESAGVLFRARPDGDRVRGLEVLLEPRERRLSLRRLQPDPGILATAPVESAADPQDLRLEVRGGRIRVWLGSNALGSPRVDVADPEPAAPAGTVGFRAWGAALSVDQLVVESAAGRQEILPDRAEADPARRALAAVCLMLLNLNETVYVD